MTNQLQSQLHDIFWECTLSQEFIDQKVGVGEAFQFALSRFFPLLGASLLLSLIVVAGLMFCIAPGILFMIWFIFIAQVIVVEDKGAIEAFTRSKDLTEGFRLQIFGLAILLVVINMAVQGGIGMVLGAVFPSYEMVPTSGPMSPFGGPGRRGGGAFMGAPNYTNIFITTLIGSLAGILVQAFQSVCFTLQYYDLRIRKEGFDLELMAQKQANTPT